MGSTLAALTCSKVFWDWGGEAGNGWNTAEGEEDRAHKWVGMVEASATESQPNLLAGQSDMGHLGTGPNMGTEPRKLIGAATMLLREQTLSYPKEIPVAASVPIGYSCCHFGTTRAMGLGV